MKKNINVFIMMGIITLACGQLHGLTKREFFELNQLEQKLNARYTAGISVQDPDAWLDGNVTIIEQIRKLDPPTAVKYQKRQNLFAKRARQGKVAEGVKEGAEKISKEGAERIRKEQEVAEAKVEAEKTVQKIQKMVQTVSKNINVQRAKSPEHYDKVDFSDIPTAIGTISQAITEAQGQLTEISYRSLQDKVNQLNTKLADAVLTNLLNLADPIIEHITSIDKYIEELHSGYDPFNFDNNKIENSINNEIQSRLYSAYQQHLLLSENVHNKSQPKILINAIETAKKIVLQSEELLSRFTRYIQYLNRINQETKDSEEEKLSVNNFVKTAQAIRVMDYVLKSLYSPLNSLFRNNIKLINNLTSNILGKENIISSLKTKLY